MTDIQNTLDQVEKMMTTPAYIQGAILTRENLDGYIDKLPFRDTPLRDRLPRKKGSGLAASWNVLTSIGVGTSAFAEGTTPIEDPTGYGRRSAIYAELGKTKSLSDKMHYAGMSFVELESELTEVAMREVIQDEEQYIITGDSIVNPLEFNGLKKYITTNIPDDNNNALGFRTDLLDSAIQTLLNNYSVKPTAIYVGYGMKRAINQSLAGDVRVNLDQTNTVSTGVDVGFFQSMI